MISHLRRGDDKENEDAEETADRKQNDGKIQQEVDEKLQKERDAEVKKLTMSLEDRMKEFRSLLLEKSVRICAVIFKQKNGKQQAHSLIIPSLHVPLACLKFVRPNF